MRQSQSWNIYNLATREKCSGDEVPGANVLRRIPRFYRKTRFEVGRVVFWSLSCYKKFTAMIILHSHL